MERKKLHRHRPQIEKVLETLFYAVRIGCGKKGTAGSQTLEPMLPNLGPTSSQFKKHQFPNVPRCFPSWNHGFPVLGTSSSQTLEPMLPNLGAAGSQFKPSTRLFRTLLSIFEPVSQDPDSLVASLVDLLQRRHGKSYPWAVGHGRPLPTGYILAKRKKEFRNGRQSFPSWTLRFVPCSFLLE